jgi:TP901 family phage tail tape measure protein
MRASQSALEFNLRMQSGQFNQAVTNAVSHFNRGLRGMERTAGRTSARIRRAMGEAFDPASLTAGAAAATTAMVSMTKKAINLEAAMADVAKVVDFPSPDGLKELENQLLKLSRTIPITVEGLAEIAAAGGQLGVAAQDLPAFVEQVARIATAFDMLPDEAGESMAKLANVFNIPVTEIESFGDVINELSNNTAAKATEIVEALRRIGGTAKQFGLAKEEAAALADAFIALGKPPETAATAINSMLSKMQTASKQSKKFQRGLAALGVEAGQLERAISRDAGGALTEFLHKLEKLDNQTRAGVLTDLFGLEFQDDIGLLVGSLGEYEKALEVAGNQTKIAGSIQREFATKAATTANQLQLAGNRAHELQTRIGQGLVPVLKEVLGPLGGIATTLAEFAEGNPKLAIALTAIGVGLSGIIAYKGGLSLLGRMQDILGRVPPVAGPAGRTVRSVGDSFGYLSGSANRTAGPMTRLRTAMGRIGQASRGAIGALSSMGNIMKGALAVGAAVGAVEIGRLAHAMWQAEQAETGVENRANAAIVAFQGLASEAPRLAGLLSDIGTASEKMAGLSDAELIKMKELIRAKFQSIEAERQRLQLEEERPILGLLTNHKEKLDKLTVSEKELWSVLRAAINAEKNRGSVATQSLTEQKEAVKETSAAMTDLKEKAETPAIIKITANTSQAIAEIAKVQSALDGLQDKTVTVTVVTRNVQSKAGGGWVAAANQVVALARGGRLPGYGGGDKVRALLEPGEFVVRKERARMFSGLLAMMNYGPISRVQQALGEIPRFQAGGMVQNLRLPPMPQLAMAGGGMVPSSGPVERFDIRLDGRPVAASNDSTSQLKGLLHELKDRSRGLL